MQSKMTPKELRDYINAKADKLIANRGALFEFVRYVKSLNEVIYQAKLNKIPLERILNDGIYKSVIDNMDFYKKIYKDKGAPLSYRLRELEFELHKHFIVFSHDYSMMTTKFSSKKPERLLHEEQDGNLEGMIKSQELLDQIEKLLNIIKSEHRENIQNIYQGNIDELIDIFDTFNFCIARIESNVEAIYDNFLDMQIQSEMKLSQIKTDNKIAEKVLITDQEKLIHSTKQIMTDLKISQRFQHIEEETFASATNKIKEQEELDRIFARSEFYRQNAVPLLGTISSTNHSLLSPDASIKALQIVKELHNGSGNNQDGKTGKIKFDSQNKSQRNYNIL